MHSYVTLKLEKDYYSASSAEEDGRQDFIFSSKSYRTKTTRRTAVAEL
jgi:hypothetical protein